jgi:hypothetical protein
LFQQTDSQATQGDLVTITDHLNAKDRGKYDTLARLPLPSKQIAT